MAAQMTPSGQPSTAQRKLWGKMGIAMPDGSYYIRGGSDGASDLQNAIDSVGQGEDAGDSGDAIRMHIMKRAAALKLSSKIPSSWNANGSLKHADTSQPTTAQRKMFAKLGYAMPDGSFYIRPAPFAASDLQNAIRAVGRGEADGGNGNDIRRHIMTRASALNLSSKIPDSWNSDGSLKQDALDEEVEDFLAHFGVKGMHWGARKDGGSSGPASDDAARAKATADKIAKSGVKSVSSADLQHLVSRRRLEQQHAELDSPLSSPAKKAAKDFAVQFGKQQASNLANEGVKAGTKYVLKKYATK